jgi:hypothetical protein
MGKHILNLDYLNNVLKMKRHYLFVSLFVLFSCTSNKDSETTIVSSIAAGEESDEELREKVKLLELEELKRIANEKANRTSISLDKLLHDFGYVNPDSENTCKFKVTNTGKMPLIIQKVSASCGCTTPHKPEKPILPRASDYIEVGFHPKPNQKDEITKTVTIEANTEPRITEVQIKAFVK